MIRKILDLASRWAWPFGIVLILVGWHFGFVNGALLFDPNGATWEAWWPLLVTLLGTFLLILRIRPR